jgi:hypothetical protein
VRLERHSGRDTFSPGIKWQQRSARRSSAYTSTRSASLPASAVTLGRSIGSARGRLTPRPPGASPAETVGRIDHPANGRCGARSTRPRGFFMRHATGRPTARSVTAALPATVTGSTIGSGEQTDGRKDATYIMPTMWSNSRSNGDRPQRPNHLGFGSHSHVPGQKGKGCCCPSARRTHGLHDNNQHAHVVLTGSHLNARRAPAPCAEDYVAPASTAGALASASERHHAAGRRDRPRLAAIV